MAEPADINVDELRRRARRRLIGAIVLALGAAVIVPMLLESEPKPLGEDVSVKIPPVDDGKFVNRLNEPSPPKDDGTKDVRKDADSPRKSVGDAEKSVVTPPAKVSKYDTNIAPEPKAITPAIPAAPAAPSIAATEMPAKAAAPKTEPAKPVEPVAAPTSAPKGDAARVAEPPARIATAKADFRPSAAEHANAPAASKADVPKEGFAVQLAAFSDDKGANALGNRLKQSGYPVYTEPLKTSRGTLWRVRVGPYPSREAATVVRDKLKGEGQNGIVAPAK